MLGTRICLSIALAAALGACNTASGPGHVPGGPSEAPPTLATSMTHASLTAYHWDLISAHDRAGQAIVALQPVAGRPLRLDFDGDRLSVSGGCNLGSGGYETSTDTLRVGPLMQTKMACADRRLMALDAAIAARLQGTLRTVHNASSATPQLELIATNGDRLVFTGTATAQTRYGSEGSTRFFEIDPQRQPCSHPLIRDMQCLRVRERRYDGSGVIASQDEWQPLYQEIEGYTHSPGQRNVVRVKRFEIKNPPADGSSVAYVLDMVIESEVVPPR